MTVQVDVSPSRHVVQPTDVDQVDLSTVAINLYRGWPSPSLLPASLIRDAASHSLSQTSIADEALQYGPDPGYEPCREAIAAWLNDFYRPSGPISSERLCITGGASQNLGCVLNVFSDPLYTQHVWLVAPAYMIVFRIFEDAGFAGKLRAVREDEHGIDIDQFRRDLEACSPATSRAQCKPATPWRRLYRHILYCVPTFSNPSSRTMTLGRRQALVRLAREFDMLIVADDVYDMLQWPAEERASVDSQKVAPLPRLVDIDRTIDGGPGSEGFGNVCSNGTFSKIIAPGARVGWAEGTEKFAYGVSQAGTTRSGGAPSQLTSTSITRLLVSGSFKQHLEHVLLPAYRHRYHLLHSAITRHLLPLGFSLPQPGRQMVGGYFIWLKLPPGLTSQALVDRCSKDEKLTIAPGEIFAIPGDENAERFEDYVRLCFAYEDPQKLEEGVKRLSRVAAVMLMG